MTNEIEQFMQTAGGGQGAPGFKFEGLEDGLMGPIVDLRVTDVTDPALAAPNNFVLNPDGSRKKQLEVTIQTQFRGWQKCKVPMDTVALPNGGQQTQPRDPSRDDGKRRIFAKGNMLYVIGEAVSEATGGATRAPAIGGTLGVKYVGNLETGKPSPAKQYLARYTAPSPAAGMDFGQPQQNQPAVNQPTQQYPAQQPQFQQPVQQQQPVYQQPQVQQQPAQQYVQQQVADPNSQLNQVAQPPVQQPVQDPFGQQPTYPGQPPF